MQLGLVEVGPERQHCSLGRWGIEMAVAKNSSLHQHTACMRMQLLKRSCAVSLVLL